MKEEVINLKKIKDDYERAYKLVSITFEGKTDKEGKPYIGHLERVSNSLENKKTKIAGLLHDILEDIDYIDETFLKELNFNDEIIEMVKIVSRDKNKTYHDFITDIIESNNIEAIKLKYADMCDNANPERLSKLEEKTKARLKAKYEIELPRLKNKIKYLEEKEEI